MVYTPKRGAFAQTQYFDQQGTALPGMLANASDINLVDSGFVGAVGKEGIEAGLGVIKSNSVGVSNRPGLNYDVYNRPGYQDTAADFAGIVVRNQFMRTNSAGNACYFFEDMCNVLSSRRVGGRIWVKLAEGSTYPGSKVYWITRDHAATGKMVGAFSGTPLTSGGFVLGAAIVGGTVNQTEVQRISNGGFDITINGTSFKISGLNFGGVASILDIAAVVETRMKAVNAPIYPITQYANGIYCASTTLGTTSAITQATAPTTAGAEDASNVLGLSLAGGALITQGTASSTLDTLVLPNARFVDTFSAAVDGMALVELF